MSFKLKDKMNNLLVLDAFVDDDLGLHIELGILAKNMKMEVIGVIDYFFSFLTKEERKESTMKKKNSQYVDPNVRT
jgi:CO dehydrogenase nickel-insertion accessory protein CooC1